MDADNARSLAHERGVQLDSFLFSDRLGGRSQVFVEF